MFVGSFTPPFRIISASFFSTFKMCLLLFFHVVTYIHTCMCLFFKYLNYYLNVLFLKNWAVFFKLYKVKAFKICKALLEGIYYIHHVYDSFVFEYCHSLFQFLLIEKLSAFKSSIGSFIFNFVQNEMKYM